MFGGQAVQTQQSRLRAGAHVVVATVGRTLDLISRGSLDLTAARYIVLDEADEMLDLGFIDEVERILRICPSGRQTSLFSATIPPPIERLADRYMYDPVTIRVTPKQITVDAIEQAFVEVPARGKVDRLVEVLRAEDPEQAIIFCRTKIGTARLDETLRAPRPAGQGAAWRPEPGPARRGHARLQGPPASVAGRDRRRRPRARHRARHPRDQLRRPRHLGGVRPPGRPHGPSGPHGPRDHLRDAQAAPGDPAHRARGQDPDRRVGAARGAARARPAPPAPRAPSRRRRRAGRAGQPPAMPP